jgi:TolA-binding protein
VTRVVNEAGEVTYEYELAAGIPPPDTSRSHYPLPPGTDRVETPGGSIPAQETPTPPEMAEAETTSAPNAGSEIASQPESSPVTQETQAAAEVSPVPESSPMAQTTETAVGAKSLYNEGIELVQAGNVPEALQRFSTVLDQYPQARCAAAARYWMGECRYAQGEYATAAEDFKASLDYEINGKREAAQIMLGLTYLRLGQDEQARRQFEALLEEFPQGEYSQKAHGLLQHLSSEG